MGGIFRNKITQLTRSENLYKNATAEMNPIRILMEVELEDGTTIVVPLQTPKRVWEIEDPENPGDTKIIPAPTFSQLYSSPE